MFSMISDADDNVKESTTGVSVADMEKILHRLEKFGSNGITAYEMEVLASLPPHMLQSTNCAHSPPERAHSPPNGKFSGFSFEHNIEDLIQRRQHCGVESLTSIELEALAHYESTMTTPNSDALSTTHPAPVVSVPASSLVEESPFSQSIQALISSLSFDNLYSRRTEGHGIDDDTSTDCLPSDAGSLKSEYVMTSDGTSVFPHFSQDLPPSLTSFNPESGCSGSIIGDLEKAVPSQLPSSPSTSHVNRCLDDANSPFHGFSFTENIMELLERRNLHGEDSLTSFEKEALEYYADVIQECKFPIESDVPAGSNFSERDDAKQYTGVTVSTYDALAIRAATESMQHLLEHVQKSRGGMPAANGTAANTSPGSNDTSAITTSVSPLEDFVVEAIRARVAAEKLMFDTSSLLEDDDEDNQIKQEADEIIRRVEAEREAEASAIIHRLDCDESHEIESVAPSIDYMSDIDDVCDITNDGNEKEESDKGSSDDDDPNDEGEKVLWYQYIKANDVKAVE